MDFSDSSDFKDYDRILWILKIFRISNLVFVQNHQQHEKSIIAPRKTIKIRHDIGYFQPMREKSVFSYLFTTESTFRIDSDVKTDFNGFSSRNHTFPVSLMILNENEIRNPKNLQNP